MSGVDLDAIRKRVERATEGPWWSERYGRGSVSPEAIYQLGPGEMVAHVFPFIPGRRQVQADAEFIARAREDVPALCDEVELLRRWKAEAMRVMDGLDRLGRVVVAPLGASITDSAIECVERLTRERDEARATLSRVDDALQMLWEEGLSGDGYGLRPHDLIEAALRGDDDA